LAAGLTMATESRNRFRLRWLPALMCNDLGANPLLMVTASGEHRVRGDGRLEYRPDRIGD
jgi:hypothetical protein